MLSMIRRSVLQPRLLLDVRDGPYVIKKVAPPTTYLISTHDSEDMSRYNVKNLTRLLTNSSVAGPTKLVILKKQRGHPKKKAVQLLPIRRI